MDPVVGTGSASMMAIRVLLDHEVDEDKIIVVSLIMASCGAQDRFLHDSKFRRYENSKNSNSSIETYT